MQANTKTAPDKILPTTTRFRKANQSALSQISAGLVVGCAVETSDGEAIGKIKNIMIHLHSRRVEYVVVDFGGFLGMGGKLFAIPFREFKYDEVRGTLSLNRAREYFEQQPGFDKSHWPKTNSHSHFDGFDIDFGAPVLRLSY